jgi:2-(1,2-epoxy-1,2-dihydrophenyl)acetyl-CoA isomerase
MAVGDDGSITVLRNGSVLSLMLDRPSHRNALSHSMIDQMVSELTTAASDETLRAVHIGAVGPDFCSGADWVATNEAGTRPRAGHLLRRIPHTAHRLIELVAAIQLPVVCSVRGWAVGLGCNLALAADFTVAADDATFWEPFAARGFTPDSGATWLLPRLIGLARAKEMLLLGEIVSASEAANWGMVHRAVAPADLEDAAAALVDRLASGPTVALGLAKQAIHHAQQATLSQALTQELYNVELSCRTADFKEGMAAFREHRPPQFGGR